jgi:DNA-binding CsgD family transcriptional regulator
MTRADRNLALMRDNRDSQWYPRMVSALRSARELPDVLTARETSALNAASHGMNRDDSAVLLGISSETVKSHLTACRRKLRARTTTHAVALAIRRGLI